MPSGLQSRDSSTFREFSKPQNVREYESSVNDDSNTDDLLSEWRSRRFLNRLTYASRTT